MRRVRYVAASLLLSTLLHSPLALATTPPATTPKPTAQAGAGGPPPLTSLAINGQGHLKEDIRKSIRDSDVILRVNWPSMTGEAHACTFYSISKENVDPLRFMALIKTHADAFMYLGVPDDQPDVAKGARYVGQELDGHVNLVVTADSPCCFMLKDESRVRPGAVVYGAFQDGAGELWVYEECVGSYFTDVAKYISVHNDQMMPTSKKYFQAILNMYLDMNPSASNGGGGTPCPAKYASSYRVGVNHHVDSGIKVAKGDKISIRASGEVTFGIMAGSGGPEGIDFLPSYNYFENLKHGCLIGRVAASEDDPWSYIGASADFTADRSGELQFNVNDNDPDNNVGEFDVKITVCKQR
jgi:hypothetical protein